jgi:hypothetical protein
MNAAMLNEIGLTGAVVTVPEQVIDPVPVKTFNDYFSDSTLKYLTIINTLLWAAFFMGWLK